MAKTIDTTMTPKITEIATFLLEKEELGGGEPLFLGAIDR
jgi:hypothetical protein